MFLIKKTSDLLSNITSIFLSIGVPYIQLSLNMEILFILVLVITLANWRKIVTQSTNSSKSLLIQWRYSFFFVSKTYKTIQLKIICQLNNELFSCYLVLVLSSALETWHPLIHLIH